MRELIYCNKPKKNTLVSGNAGDEQSSPGRLQIYFLINLTEFFKQNLHLKNYSNCTFLCGKTKSPTSYCSKRKIRQFIRINFLVENRLKNKF